MKGGQLRKGPPVQPAELAIQRLGELCGFLETALKNCLRILNSAIEEKKTNGMERIH